MKLEIENTRLKNKEVRQERLIAMNADSQKKFQEQLQREKVENEKLTNRVIELKHTNSLIKMETDIIGNRLNILNNSIKSLGNMKEEENKTAL